MDSNGSRLSIIPLGGIGEIGMNSTVLECGDDMIVIDAGSCSRTPRCSAWTL